MQNTKLKTFFLLVFILLSSLAFGTAIAATPNSSPSNDQANKALEQLFGGLNNPSDELLLPEQAFNLSVEVIDATTIQLHWAIADGYYLYKDKVKVELIEPSTVQLQPLNFPTGKEKYDEIFGDTLVYYNELILEQHLNNTKEGATKVSLTISFQGCADIGVCYPPMSKTLHLSLPKGSTLKNATSANQTIDKTSVLSEQEQIADSLIRDTLWLTCLTFLGLGLVLSFTPCVLPMVPILSGILIGHGHALTTRKAILISFSYVVAAALTYALFGVLAGLFGSNLQASFQNPWIIGSFSFVFVLLALSMFGIYQLQLPASLQTKLSKISQHQAKQTVLGSAVMGFLSALIVGPCVAAPLAGVLIYIGRTGDATLGGFALFSMGIGMGIPLLLIGTSAGKLLPKVGHWMESIKSFFGVMLLAVAIWLIDRIIPAGISIVLWGLLFVAYGVYLKATERLAEGASNWQRLAKSFGIISLLYGIILIIGAASGGTNPLQPLANLSINKSTQQNSALHFTRVSTLTELDTTLKAAILNKQAVMLDFYADWCVSCKEMEAFTFTDPEVHNALQNTLLLQIDVTENNDEDRAILKHFNLIGPPAILFFTPDSNGRSTGRVIGYMKATPFVKNIKQAIE
ncbi:MAG: cytochrome C biogenesis protein [Cycloclasticus sp. symbiont of Poecilosclerida sp. M]|nr:MAG: cytochrome C biogenesis protein [Cycloclasticus sp. symbiont of Poecilosclerida sp. M]